MESDSTRKRKFTFKISLRNQVKFLEQLSTRRNQSAGNCIENMQGQPEDIMLYNAKFYKDGKEYHFISAERMTRGTSAIEFFEFSSQQGNMFGT